MVLSGRRVGLWPGMVKGKTTMKKWWALMWVAVLLVGCAQAKATSAPAAQEVQEPVKGTGNTVIAEGEVRPARSSSLSFKLPGEVVEALVESGDQVEAGAPLARLDTREMSLSLRSAEQDVIAQQAALQRLKKGASEKVIARADKGNADQIAQAEVALEVKRLQLAQTQAEDPTIGVAAAEARVKQLEYSLAQTRARDPAPAVTSAQVTLERAQIALADAQDEYSKALDRPWEDQEIRDAWADRLEQVTLDYRAAQAALDNALNEQRAYQVGLQVMAAQIEEARTQLDQAVVAQKTYSSTLDILAADVEIARLQLEALRTWDNPYRDEATDEEIAQAEVLVRKAEIAVETLKLQMEDAVLEAPFAGTVVEADVKVGDQVTPGQVVFVLASLADLRVYTTDLTELDVARVAVGQPVTVRVDALPGREFAGTVREIALQGQDFRGDVVYEVTVGLDDVPAAEGLRWGMTTMVEIEVR
jgi:HlyD family secretion protein